jgi:hypothetical protein|tara:strand:- start:3836 stop:4018 length:183 start_codon:yes stop_codon:yes gene_type:complete
MPPVGKDKNTYELKKQKKIEELNTKQKLREIKEKKKKKKKIGMGNTIVGRNVEIVQNSEK